MSDFNLKLYKTTDDYKAKKAKLRYFFEYLELQFYTIECFDNSFFETLDVEELLNSLDYYIDENRPAKQTADDYKRTLINFFEMLYNDYNIKNQVVTDATMRNYFNSAVKNKTQSLGRTSKECFDDNDLEYLREEIDNFLNIQDLEEQIIEDVYTNNGKFSIYRRFLSILPLKIVMKYGAGNTLIAKLTTQDLDLNQSMLKINDFSILLDREMINLFQMYLKIREKIISANNVDSNYLFIDGDGKPLFNSNGSAENGTLFYLMKKTLGTSAGKKLGYTTTIDLVKKGADIYMLSLLVDTTPEKIFSLSESCENIEKRKENIERLLSNSERKFKKVNNKTEYMQNKDYDLSTKEKGMSRCVFCGKVKRVIADEWVLVQVDDNETIYLACKDCEGDDGKIKY